MASNGISRPGDATVAGLADRTTGLVGWTIAWRATSAVATLALGAFLIRQLSPSEYGRYTFVLSVLVYIALVATFVGLALLVGAVQLRAGWALILAFGSPLLYSVYILAGERVTKGVPTVVSSVLVHVGGAITMVAVLLVAGPRTLPQSVAAWAVVTAVALLPSMVGISLFLAGLARVGATRAAIMSTVEPAVTVGLAAALLGDRLNVFQGVGAVLVLAAVILMQWRRREAIPPFEP